MRITIGCIIWKDEWGFKHMSLFLSLVIFAIAIYIFLMTNNKIKNIKDNILIEDAKKELESVITEFNGAAARNIEILETKITELQDIMKKADIRVNQLDDRIERAHKPIVIEKLVEAKITRPAEPAKVEQEPKQVRQKQKPLPKSTPEPEVELISAPVVLEKPQEVVVPVVEAEMSRSEQLKKLLREGKTKDELLLLGYLENEINLLSFLIRKNVS